MFDAKSLFETMVRGAPPQQRAGTGQPPAGGGGLGDLLGQVLGGSAGRQGGAGSPMDGLGELLRNLQTRSDGAAGGTARSGGGLDDLLRNIAPGGSAAGGGGLGDILGKLQQQMGQGKGGDIADILRNVLGQATSGVREGAQRVDEATGASTRARDAVGQATGRSPDELINQLRELLSNNQLGAGAALGGLGALILGTSTGRSMAANAAKLGALAMVGGLAYKAYQNYTQGRPLIDGASSGPEAAPQGSGFEEHAITNEAATTYIRAMIAAANSDGRLDAKEQQNIIGGLKQAGIDAEAEEFLASELNAPATVDTLAAAVRSPEEAVQVYTAARIAIEPDSAEENEFLRKLAAKLKLDQKLAAHIDATARGMAA